ncbi:amidase [Amycolatopsis pithecellobii]|uniref:Amidase n=1 Tax=Amycolatopsis pithecellobii TaxID=664692 RepID=A0A6N7Z0Z6_9PSEU|nr:amidase [Amycolatopsis pithecellobii]MTD54409.1 amidase [Amycolatopsis pithecellobii]
MSTDDVVEYDPATFEGLRFHTAVSAFRDGTDSPREYLERCLATISEREPAVRAWVVLNEQEARKQADASTARWRNGEPRSPIDGIPMGIKDLLETRDMPTQMGCAAFTGNFPKRDNAAVWALRQAGAVILGKTVTTELGGPEPSPTRNPFNPKHTPGGSSSGSGAAVGARMVPVTIATQTGGSLMRPASFNGNWGLKPSQGAINRGERQTASMTSHGVLAACPEDMWLVAIAIASRAGGDPGWPALSGPAAPPAARQPGTLAVMETEGWERLDDVSRGVFEQVLAQLESRGVTVLRRSQDAVVARFERALRGVTDLGSAILAWEHFWAFRDVVANNPDGVSARGKRFFIEAAEKLGAAGYEEALRDRAAVKSAYALLGPRVDAVIAPTSSGSAPQWLGDIPGHEPARWPTGDPAFNFPSSLLGAPAVNVPLMAVGGLPFGLQVMGQPGTDAKMAAIARWIGTTLTPVSG